LNGDLSVGEALSRFRRLNGIPSDRAATWTCRLGPLTLRLPNFRWRRAAIARHDLHHILTGYPCTLRGECQMAAWEFAAGRFPHPAATLFCLPLVALGTLWSPRTIWAAFRDGRRSRSLYDIDLSERLLQAPLPDLRRARLAARLAKPLRADAAAFAFLLVQAAALLLAPAVLAAALLAAV
jgi:hypothetical protein